MTKYIITLSIILLTTLTAVFAQDQTDDDLVNQNGNIETETGFDGAVKIKTTNPANIILGGPTSDYTISLQDGTGRIQHYWNATTNPSTYINSNEHAGKILFSPASSNIFSIYQAPKGVAGNNISWEEYLRLSNSGVFSIYKPGSSTGNVSISSPDGNPGLVFTSNEPEKIRGDIYMTKTGFEFAPGTSTGNPGTKMVIQGTGEIGMGTGSPTSKLHTLGTIRAGNYQNETLEIGHGGSHGFINNIGDGNIDFRHEGSTKASILSNGVFRVNKTESLAGALYLSGRAWGMVFDVDTDANGGSYIWRAKNNEIMTLKNSGKLGIGTTNPDAILTVNGDIHATEIFVDNQILTPDFVFEENFSLKTIEEKAAYVAEFKHLPAIQSAAEMDKNNVNLLKLNYGTLQELEEAYLYIFQLSEQLKGQQAQIQAQKTINDKLIKTQNEILKMIEELK